MSRVGSLIFAVIVILALVIAVDARARAKAVAFVRELEPALKKLDDIVIVKAPRVGSENQSPAPTPTPVPTPAVNSDKDDKDSSSEPIIIINWDALRDRLRKIWETLNAKINNDLKSSP